MIILIINWEDEGVCSDDSGRVPVIDPNIALDYLIDMDTALVAR